MEGVCAEFGKGGGAKYFFFGAEIPTKFGQSLKNSAGSKSEQLAANGHV